MSNIPQAGIQRDAFGMPVDAPPVPGRNLVHCNRYAHSEAARAVAVRLDELEEQILGLVLLGGSQEAKEAYVMQGVELRARALELRDLLESFLQRGI